MVGGGGGERGIQTKTPSIDGGGGRMDIIIIVTMEGHGKWSSSYKINSVVAFFL